MLEDIIEDQRNEDASPRPYKINIGDTIQVHRQDVITAQNKHYVFYSTKCKKTEVSGRVGYYKKGLAFKKNVDLKDKTWIKIRNMFEDARVNTKDRYEPIWFLFITDFDIISEQETEDNVIEAYQDSLNGDGIELDF